MEASANRIGIALLRLTAVSHRSVRAYVAFLRSGIFAILRSVLASSRFRPGGDAVRPKAAGLTVPVKKFLGETGASRHRAAGAKDPAGSRRTPRCARALVRMDLQRNARHTLAESLAECIYPRYAK